MNWIVSVLAKNHQRLYNWLNFNFIKALDQKGQSFFFKKINKSSRISEAKKKEDIFDGPEIRQLWRTMILEKVWPNFLRAINFLENTKAESYREPVTELLKSYRALGYNVSLEIHFLYLLLNFFPVNLGDRPRTRWALLSIYFNHGYSLQRKMGSKYACRLLLDSRKGSTWNQI